jgi:hypothetical protein
MDFTEILRRHAAALLRDLAAGLEDEPEPAGLPSDLRDFAAA